MTALRPYILMTVEACLAAVGILAASAILIGPADLLLYLEVEDGWLRIGTVVLTYLGSSYLSSFFRQVNVTSRVALTLQVLQLLGLILIIHAVVGFIDPRLMLSQPVMVLGTFLTFLIVIPWRMFVRPALWNVFGTKRILLIGSGRGVEHIAAAYRNAPILGGEIIGSIPAEGFEPTVFPVCGSTVEFDSIIREQRPDEIIVDTKAGSIFLQSLMELKASGVTVRTVAQEWEVLFGRVYSYGLDPSAVIYRNELDARPFNLALQSIYNNLLGLIAAVLLFPLMLMIALFLKVARSGPVFTKTHCIGLHGIPFTLYRFHPGSGVGPVFRIMKRLRIEGLPQIMNLLRGEMALIGPRAERIEFHHAISQMLPFYRQRHHVKVGIFGWSQLHCDGLPEEETLARIEYDLYYIKHVSLLIDAHVAIEALRWLLSEPQTGDVAA